MSTGDRESIFSVRLWRQRSSLITAMCSYMPARSKLFACIVSPDVGRDEEILLSIAYSFAYRVEVLEDGVLFDVSGLEKLVGNTQTLAKGIVKKLKEHNISG